MRIIFILILLLVLIPGGFAGEESSDYTIPEYSEDTVPQMNDILRRTARRLRDLENGRDINTETTGTLSLSRGGTGESLSDPDDDRILFWDDSDGQIDWLDIGTGLSISGKTISSQGTDFTLGDKDATESKHSTMPTSSWETVKSNSFLFSFFKKSQHSSLTVYWKGRWNGNGNNDQQRVYITGEGLAGEGQPITSAYQEISNTINISSLANNSWYSFQIQGYTDSTLVVDHYVKEVRWFVE